MIKLKNLLNERRGSVNSFKDVKMAVQTLFSDKRVGVDNQAKLLYTTSNPSKDKYAIVNLDNSKVLTFIYDDDEKQGAVYIEGDPTKGYLFGSFDDLVVQLQRSEKWHSKWFEKSGIDKWV